jgi:hypothetical protein
MNETHQGGGIMKKIIGAIFGILIAVIVIAVVARNFILKSTIQMAVTSVTGFKTTIEDLRYDLPSTILIKGLDIKNPKGFSNETFVNVPEIFATLELKELLKSKKVHLPEVRLNIQEVHIEKNAQGVSNVEMLSSVGGKKASEPAPVQKKPEPGSGEVMPFQLDKLVLTIRNVSYEDHSGLVGKAPIPGKRLAVDLNVQQEVFSNITDPQALVNLILVKILNSATLGRILNIDPKQLLGDNAGKILTSGQQILTEQAGMVTQQVGNLAGQATTIVTDNQVAHKAEALVGSSATTAKSVLGNTTGAAKDQVSGLFGKLKTLQPEEKTAEQQVQ